MKVNSFKGVKFFYVKKYHQHVIYGIVHIDNTIQGGIFFIGFAEFYCIKKGNLGLGIGADEKSKCPYPVLPDKTP